jgi:hypothetical protein
MKLISIVIAAGLLIAGLVASLYLFSIESTKAVVTKLNGAAATLSQLDIFNVDAELNVLNLFLITVGFVCFITLRGK